MLYPNRKQVPRKRDDMTIAQHGEAAKRPRQVLGQRIEEFSTLLPQAIAQSRSSGRSNQKDASAYTSTILPQLVYRSQIL